MGPRYLAFTFIATVVHALHRGNSLYETVLCKILTNWDSDTSPSTALCKKRTDKKKF